MAGFVFENGSQVDASSFKAGDVLVFQSDVPTDLTVTPGETDFGGSYVALSDGTQTLLFSTSALASTGSTLFLKKGAGELQFGDDSDNTISSSKDGDSAYYGFGGDDTISIGHNGNSIAAGGAGDDSITLATGVKGAFTLSGDAGDDVIIGGLAGDATDKNSVSAVIEGGAGNDSLVGTQGNDHIYGSSVDAAQGSTDGADTLDGGAGNDYIQGNAGDDVIDGGLGSDRLRGGAGDDTIDGGAGNDEINGNKGKDVIDGGDGNDVIHGGQDNDVLAGSAGNDILMGDLGDDTLSGGAGFDVLAGGDGKDTFVFGAGDATITFDVGTGGAVTYGTAKATSTVTDQITDFTDGQDHITLDFSVSSVLHQSAGASFTDMAAAQNYAQDLLTGAGDNDAVAAINVGADTYLFFNGAAAGTGIDSAIQLLNTDASLLTDADFTAPLA